MLVEINLLPRKEPKKLGFIISLSSLLVILLLVGAYYLWQIHVTKSEAASLDKQIAMTKRVAQNQEQTVNSAEAKSSVNQLKSAIDWANDYPIQTIPVMQHLTSLLPERGFIESFSYTEAGTIALTVQFDSTREAAYFLDSLNESKWISEASLSSLATSESTAASTETTGTNQSNGTSSTTTTSNQSNATLGTTDETNTGAVTTATQTVTGATDNGSGQMTAGTASVTQGSTDTAATNPNAVVNTTTNSTSLTTNTNKNVLPRYTGQFEIKLDKEYVKKTIKSSKKDEEGVTGS